MLLPNVLSEEGDHRCDMYIHWKSRSHESDLVLRGHNLQQNSSILTP